MKLVETSFLQVRQIYILVVVLSYSNLHGTQIKRKRFLSNKQNSAEMYKSIKLAQKSFSTRNCLKKRKKKLVARLSPVRIANSANSATLFGFCILQPNISLAAYKLEARKPLD